MNQKKLIKFNRIALLVGVGIVVIGLLIYWSQKLYDRFQFQELTLYFADSQYKKLHKELRSISKDIPNDEKLKFAMELLINGPADYNLTALMFDTVRIKGFWNIDNTLHINLSEAFLEKISSKLKDDRLIVYSILGTYFDSFPDIEKIRLYVENEPLKAIFGWNNFDKTYKRASFEKEKSLLYASMN